jgi:demethylmenaquinone methyltransferase/2-methoxy-6-polyprenyl-1,4-benzoquinol methylase
MAERLMPATLLRDWPTDGAARRAYADAVFRRVAPRYDLLTRLLSFGSDRKWKEELVSLLPQAREGSRILDLATGTGELPILVRRAGRTEPIVALDRNREMLRQARAKGVGSGASRVAFVVGDLNSLPVAERAFDAVLMGYGLRYPIDLPATLSAIHRALRPGGVFLSLDFGLPDNAWYRRLCLAYLMTAGTLWGALLHGRPGTYWHIVESLRAYPGQRALLRMLEEAGFARSVVADKLGGIAVIAMGERG